MANRLRRAVWIGAADVTVTGTISVVRGIERAWCDLRYFDDAATVAAATDSG